MKTCKDCIHYDMCEYEYPDFVHEKEDKNADMEKECIQFKDKSLFVELPCKVGDTVYLVDRTRDGRLGNIYRVVECSVEKIVLRYSTFQKRTIVEAHLYYEGDDYFGCVVEKILHDTNNSFGHTVFTNEQDAENAREKMEKEYLEEINRERDAMKNDV